MLTVDQPRPNDALCGRGKDYFRHIGNYRLRQLIVEHASAYAMASTKKEKGEVITLVANVIIARGGRFLVRNKDGSKSWRGGGLKQGQKKTGHAFRDAARDWDSAEPDQAWLVSPPKPLRHRCTSPLNCQRTG